MPKKFRFNGIPKPDYVKLMGPVLEIRIPKKDGTYHVIKAGNPQAGIRPNDLIDVPDDPRALRHMRKHPHFTEQP